MSFDLRSFQILLLVAVFWLLVAPKLSKTRNSHRAAVTGFTTLIGLNYLFWRYFKTVVPFKGSLINGIWINTVFVVEILAFIEVCIFFLIMSRYCSPVPKLTAIWRKFRISLPLMFSYPLIMKTSMFSKKPYT
ncbi:MAG: hypothetical protein PHV59_10965, partial [Victivallales bacterium]|nr:hypothetical protein [Victivallales bacterium]